MTTIGKAWLERQKRAGIEKQLTGEEEERRQDGEAARNIIRDIPRLIEIAKSADSVCVFKWVTHKDVPGTHRDKVDRLAARLEKERRPLRADDLTGRAAMVFAWCDQNDLECFLVSMRVPMNEDEYAFHVRPKSG